MVGIEIIERNYIYRNIVNKDVLFDVLDIIRDWKKLIKSVNRGVFSSWIKLF